MPAHFAHKSYYINVNLFLDTFRSDLFTPTVDVGEGGKLVVNLGTSQAFADEKDAEACGFELGREWIDKKSLPATN